MPSCTLAVPEAQIKKDVLTTRARANMVAMPVTPVTAALHGRGRTNETRSCQCKDASPSSDAGSFSNSVEVLVRETLEMLPASVSVREGASDRALTGHVFSSTVRGRGHSAACEAESGWPIDHAAS